MALLTSGDIARVLDANVSRVRQVLNTRPIEPVQRAGIVRLYDDKAVQAVREEIASMDARRLATA